MRNALAVVVVLIAAGCRPSGNDGAASPSPAPGSGDVTVTLSSTATEYRASFRTAGGMEVPLIPLVLVVKNGGTSAWTCDGAISLAVEGERGKSSATRSFLTTLSPCALAPGAEHREELEAGELLTEVAAKHMKGDRLAVRGALAPSPMSAPLAIDVFVPEG